MQNVLPYADAVITIANKGKEKLADGIVDDPDKIHVIRNGFSVSDARKTSMIDDDMLHIVHTGSLYRLCRADLLFQAVSIAKQETTEFKYVIECAGGNNSSLMETARKYNEDSNVCDRGFIPREKALDMQSKADILLALVRDKPGSVAAKLYEYMLARKPVVCVTCGQSGSVSEETSLVRELDLGIAIEESEGKEAIESLARYLVQQWKLKTSGKSLAYSPNLAKINEFNHDNLVKKVELLCYQVKSN